MENPLTWSEFCKDLNYAEKIVEALTEVVLKHRALPERFARMAVEHCMKEHQKQMNEHVCGLSLGKQIENFLSTPWAHTTLKT